MPPWPNRHWLRFRLRTLFVFVTGLALVLGWELSIVNSRRTALINLRAKPAALVIAGSAMETLPPPSRVAAWRWKLREWMGDEPIAIIRFDEGRTKSEIELATRLFPEADVSEKLPGTPVGVPPTRKGFAH